MRSDIFGRHHSKTIGFAHFFFAGMEHFYRDGVCYREVFCYAPCRCLMNREAVTFSPADRDVV